VQVAWLLWRSGLGEIRDPNALFSSAIQSIFSAVYLGRFFYQLSYDQVGILNLNGIQFFKFIKKTEKFLKTWNFLILKI